MACKCLNVRIRPQPEHTKPPDFLIANLGHPDYNLTYVGEHGVTIEHPQVTVRTRKIGQPIPDSPWLIRYITLTCLICQTLAYRVQQLVPPDVDSQEGPLLPSSEWVEQETLKSSYGWIEVYKDCLVSNAIAALFSSSDFSPVFHMAVPQSAIPSPDESASEDSPESPDHSQYDAPPGPFLSNLKPLFPPAPFVPPHPVFSYLLSLAEGQCETLRAEAEKHIAAIIREKVAELQVAEDRLRRDVKCLWKQFIENVGKVQKETGVIARKGQGGSHGRPPNSTSVSGTPLVSVREFVPVVSPAERVRSPMSPIPRVSSLSASLATSAFYHPAARNMPSATTRSPDVESPSSSPYSLHPSSSLDSPNGRSPPTDVESPGPSPRASRDTIIQPFRRKMDEQQDTTVSFRYFTIVEAEAARKRQQQSTTAHVAGAEDRGRTVEKPAETSGDMKATKSDDNEISTTERRAKEGRPTKLDGGEDKAPPEATTPKSKRRVTFDIKVETDDANEKSNKGSPVEKSWGNEELIFDLEDEVESGEREVPEATQVPWLVDSAPTSPSHERNHSGSRDGRPTSSSLWPASLPVRSIALVRMNGDVDGSSVHTNSVRDAVPPLTPSEEQKTEDDVDPEEEDILKLVAAYTPSHRSAWKRRGKTWKALMGSSYLKGVPGALIPKENEDDSERTPNETDDSDLDASQDMKWTFQAGIPASLPVNIRPLVRRREPLSLASYRPKTSLPDRAGVMVPPLPDPPGGRHVSSLLSHAGRDQTARSGTADFLTAEADEDGERSEDEPTQVGIPDEARGRQRALKILKARSKIPAASMWRSLA
ncbi:hypothetical protein PISMIDRAFT_672442 [Pisolithus microcarpus 441]|uniref:Uncharacterized protein n=1 Tax=Pisolithus microcarpus 441 TaxID=765257 RepID=A0A0C9ZSS7_9AGAM|nr:hypothetical protein PISMIDRAFT_672442 [Pisolithus microcarpus 441]